MKLDWPRPVWEYPRRLPKISLLRVKACSCGLRWESEDNEWIDEQRGDRGLNPVDDDDEVAVEWLSRWGRSSSGNNYSIVCNTE